MKKTKNLIIDFIKENQPVTANQLQIMGISKAMIHRHLKKLINDNLIIKKGTPPKVFYFIKENNLETISFFSDSIKNILNQEYVYISPDGKIEYGLNGFISWCKTRNLETKKTAQDYVKTWKKYHKFKKNGFINGTDKLKTTFKNKAIDKLYYCDFYSIERFGKTKIGNFLLYAKQSQNIELIQKIALIIKNPIQEFIKKYNINSIAYVPHSIKRNVQLIPEIKKFLNINLPVIDVLKITDQIPVPQKSLSRFQDRITNAKNTIFPKKNHYQQFNNILLFDDAVGSGATMNETAKKIKNLKIAKKVFGLAIVGSFKGFEVISEI